ncbi:FeoC-like transcriptional regulator [Candidatus Thiothrix anitrata]|uniref:Transcriptional regulator HTH-type FeoC domain-containing protein n=1 Tax=Candidatus Thiothrix anitrata TaxID=2823902 RepID=A0ABX7X112_9GAMM|nr:FeoC-like transcriptional regulator [Candidatus Thiothrix anitrata]QTR49291.1 hypothetical protein J8380_13640 [Candidatus Thiothrix anitrata]
MILSRITAYLREHKRASLLDMSYALEATPDALKAMLSTLERKGRVRRLPAARPVAVGAASVTRTAWNYTSGSMRKALLVIGIHREERAFGEAVASSLDPTLFDVLVIPDGLSGQHPALTSVSISRCCTANFTTSFCHM